MLLEGIWHSSGEWCHKQYCVVQSHCSWIWWFGMDNFYMYSYRCSSLSPTSSKSWGSQSPWILYQQWNSLQHLHAPTPANFPCCSSTPQISWLYTTCSVSLEKLCIYHCWLSCIQKSLPASHYPIFRLSCIAKRRYCEQDCFAAPWQEHSTWWAISNSGEICHWLLIYHRRNPSLGWWPGWWANWYNLQNVCLWDWWVLASGISTILLEGQGKSCLAQK